MAGQDTTPPVQVEALETLRVGKAKILGEIL